MAGVDKKYLQTAKSDRCIAHIRPTVFNDFQTWQVREAVEYCWVFLSNFLGTDEIQGNNTHCKISARSVEMGANCILNEDDISSQIQTRVTKIILGQNFFCQRQLHPLVSIDGEMQTHNNNARYNSSGHSGKTRENSTCLKSSLFLAPILHVKSPVLWAVHQSCIMYVWFVLVASVNQLDTLPTAAQLPHHPPYFLGFETVTGNAIGRVVRLSNRQQYFNDHSTLSSSGKNY